MILYLIPYYYDIIPYSLLLLTRVEINVNCIVHNKVKSINKKKKYSTDRPTDSTEDDVPGSTHIYFWP